MPRRTSTAAKRVALAKDEGNSLSEETLTGMLEAFSPYIKGMIDTLGLAAQPRMREDGTVEPGDLDAAKKALDFLGRALAGSKAETKGTDMLAEIAKIRGGNH